MRIHISSLLVRVMVAGLGIGLSSSAAALTIFACEPEWAALTAELAPQAQIVSATHARQDPHYIEARPSLIAGLRRADLAVCTGAELESGWLPVLLRRAGNPRVRPGQPGMLFASDIVTLIDQNSSVDRAEGHLHSAGNPHLNLDPLRLQQVATELVKRLSLVDPSRAADYQSRYDTWASQWAQHMMRWAHDAASLRGRTVVAQHSSFAYFWRWLGIKQIADLEPKPGLPPTPAHLRSIVIRVRQARPIAIVQTLYQDTKPVKWLHDQTDVTRLSLPSTVTDHGAAATLDGLFDRLIRELRLVVTPPRS